MSKLASLRNSILVKGYDPDTEAKIWATLDILYDGSPTIASILASPGVARSSQMINAVAAITGISAADVASRYNSLIIINNSDGSDSLAGARLVRFNVDDKIYYIDTHGSIVRYGYDLGLTAGFEHVLGHEIVHAIIGLTDGACSGATSYEQLFSAILHNHPTTSDLQSPTVVKYNQVLRDLGSPYQRSSYLQAIPVSDANFYNLQNFTDGNEIDASIAVLDSDSHNELQVCVARSRRTNRVGLNAGGGVGWLSPNGVFR